MKEQLKPFSFKSTGVTGVSRGETPGRAEGQCEDRQSRAGHTAASRHRSRRGTRPLHSESAADQWMAGPRTAAQTEHARQARSGPGRSRCHVQPHVRVDSSTPTPCHTVLRQGTEQLLLPGGLATLCEVCVRACVCAAREDRGWAGKPPRAVRGPGRRDTEQHSPRLGWASLSRPG